MARQEALLVPSSKSTKRTSTLMYIYLKRCDVAEAMPFLVSSCLHKKKSVLLTIFFRIMILSRLFHVRCVSLRLCRFFPSCSLVSFSFSFLPFFSVESAFPDISNCILPASFSPRSLTPRSHSKLSHSTLSHPLALHALSLHAGRAFFHNPRSRTQCFRIEALTRPLNILLALGNFYS